MGLSDGESGLVSNEPTGGRRGHVCDHAIQPRRRAGRAERHADMAVPGHASHGEGLLGTRGPGGRRRVWGGGHDAQRRAAARPLSEGPAGGEGEWRTATPDGADLHRDTAAEKEAFKKFPNTWKAGGGSLWSASAVDPELGLIYVGTGNPSPQMDDSTRPGDNLYTVSLVALDAETGRLKWHYQQVPHDRWGYDVASPAVLFDVTKDGRTIKAVGQAGKTGWFYVHDRRTGKLLLRSEPFVPQENMFARPTAGGVRIAPSAPGGSSWSPVAFSPQTEAVYISVLHMPARYISRTLGPGPSSPWKSYTFFVPLRDEHWGTFTAIHASTGKIVWQKKTDQPMVGGALATAGGLVFVGEGHGYFDAFGANAGDVLWRFRCDAGVNAPPISYEVDGVQYLAVAAGGNSIFGYPLGDEIKVFALP